VHINRPGNAAFSSPSPALLLAVNTPALVASPPVSFVGMLFTVSAACGVGGRGLATPQATPPTLAYFSVAVVALHANGGVLGLPSVARGCDGACACSLPPPSTHCNRLKDWWRFQG
jgi:hypothetical protein